jgi:site-specific recombinase XerD
MGEVKIRKALDDYKTVYMPYRNFADRTRVEYLNDLKQFASILEEAGIQNISQIGVPVIERYGARLERKGFASLTRKRKVVAIRSFLSFLHQEGYIDTNLANQVVLPYTECTAPHVLTQAECDRLRKACSESLRDLAIVELTAQTGIKLSELTRLTIDDIELGEKQQGYMRIRGNRAKKERAIPLNSKATLAVRDYLDKRTAEPNTILFLNRFGEAFGARGVQKMLKKVLSKARIEGASIQTLRYSFGAHHVARGTDPKTVQDVLGLRDARSVAIYQSLAREVISRELQENAL